jgi:hypothetical protein
MANNTLAAVIFSQTFYSIQVNGHELLAFPDGFSPIYLQRNKQILPLKRKLFCKNLQPFKRIGLTREEFLLLRTIILLQTG